MMTCSTRWASIQVILVTQQQATIRAMTMRAYPSTVIMSVTANDSKNAQAVCNVTSFASWNCDY